MNNTHLIKTEYDNTVSQKQMQIYPKNIAKGLSYFVTKEEIPGKKILSTEIIPLEIITDNQRAAMRKKLNGKKLVTPNEQLSRMPGDIQGFATTSIPFRGVPSVRYISPDFPENFKPYGTEPGWMLRPLAFQEGQINNRWLFWEESNNNKKIMTAAWKKIDFSELNIPTIEMLGHCIKQIEPDFENSQFKWNAIHYFFDWLLWSLGHSSVPDFPQIVNYYGEGNFTEWQRTAHNRLMQVFDINYIILFPGDYFGYFLETFSDDTEAYKFSLTTEKAQIWCNHHFKNQSSNSIDINDLILDPNVESGRLLLAASNYATKCIGVSANTWESKAAILNLYFYAPHLLYEFDFLNSDINWNKTFEFANKISELKGCLLASDYDSPSYQVDDSCDLSPIIKVTKQLLVSSSQDDFFALGGSNNNALPSADDFFALGGSKNNALPSADDFLNSGSKNNALPSADDFLNSGSKNNALPSADDFFNSGSKNNALPSADDFLDSGSKNNALPSADDFFNSGSKNNALPSADDFFANKNEEQVEQPISDRKLLGGG